jgi:hypothetical protein
MTPSAPPPIDPANDAWRRQRAAAQTRSNHWAVAALAAQFLASFAAGAWAARIADDGSGVIGLYAGVACVFALAGALAASRAVRFAFGSVLALAGLPDFIRKVTTSPPPPHAPPDPRQQRQEWWLHMTGTVVHAGALLLLFLVIALAVAFSGPASLGALAWRFALASVAVSLFTWKALKIDW